MTKFFLVKKFYMMEIAEKLNFNLYHGVEYIAQHHEYSSFGVLQKVTDANGVDISSAPIIDPYFTYTGREYDKETGLFYYRGRMYSSEIGRFLSADPYAGSMSAPKSHINKYTYVRNNPINRIDPSGMLDLGDVVGFAMGGFVYVEFRDEIRQWATEHRSEIISVGVIAAGSALILASGGTATPIVVAAVVGGTAYSCEYGWNTKNFLLGAAGAVAATGIAMGGAAAGAALADYAGAGAGGVLAASAMGGALGGVAGAEYNARFVHGRHATKGEMWVGGLLGGAGGLFSAYRGDPVPGSEMHDGASTGLGGVPTNDSSGIGDGCIWAFGECSK